MSRALNLCQFARTSVGKKFIVGITGLGLSGFALSHMAGNLLLFVGPDAYNRYSHALTSNPLIYVAEAALVLFFLVHMGVAAKLAIENRKAAEVRQPVAARKKDTTFAAKTMIYSGGLLLVFLVLHLITFKYGTYYSYNLDGVEIRDMYRLVQEQFQEPLYVGWYVFSLIVLGLHLSHGVSAAFQSLGVASSLNPGLKKIGMAVALFIAVGFLSQPLYLFFQGVN